MVAFDQCPERPEHIAAILNGLDRYNPETVTTFQEYVNQQCENQTYDCYANLALLKLYQFNPHLSREESITTILTKALTVFPAADFSLCLHLLPPSVLATVSGGASNGAARPVDTSSLAESVQKLNVLNTQLCAADYAAFWATLRSDDLYADLIAEVGGFEDLVRERIAALVGHAVREVSRAQLEEWLDLKGAALDKFVGDCGWKADGASVAVPLNKENEAKGTVVRENVKFDQFSRVVRRAYEQPV